MATFTENYSHFKKEDLTPDFIKGFFYNEKNSLRVKRTDKTFLKKCGLYDLLKSVYPDKKYSIVEIIYRIIGDYESLEKYKKKYRFTYTGPIPTTKDEVTDKFLNEFFVENEVSHTKLLISTYYENVGQEELYELMMSCCNKKETLQEFIERRLNISYMRQEEPFDPSKMTIEQYIDNVLMDKNGNYISIRTTEKYLKKNNAYEAIMSYYKDSHELIEIFFRYKNKINVRPVCKCCGGPVNFTDTTGSRPKGFFDYCSQKCASKGNKSVQNHFNSFEQNDADEITLNDLKLIGVYSSDGEHNFRKMTAAVLKKNGFYNAAMKMFDKESKLEESGVSLPQIAHKIIFGDFKRCPVCNKPVNFQKEGYWPTVCSNACLGRYRSNEFNGK